MTSKNIKTECRSSTPQKYMHMYHGYQLLEVLTANNVLCLTMWKTTQPRQHIDHITSHAGEDISDGWNIDHGCQYLTTNTGRYLGFSWISTASHLSHSSLNEWCTSTSVCAYFCCGVTMHRPAVFMCGMVVAHLHLLT